VFVSPELSPGIPCGIPPGGMPPHPPVRLMLPVLDPVPCRASNESSSRGVGVSRALSPPSREGAREPSSPKLMKPPWMEGSPGESPAPPCESHGAVRSGLRRAGAWAIASPLRDCGLRFFFAPAGQGDFSTSSCSSRCGAVAAAACARGPRPGGGHSSEPPVPADCRSLEASASSSSLVRRPAFLEVPSAFILLFSSLRRCCRDRRPFSASTSC